MLNSFKKRFLISSSFIILNIFVIFPQVNIYAGTRLLIVPPTIENISEKNKLVLSGIILDKINANLQEYTDFILIDGINERKIIELQKKSENISMDQETSIEIGKLLNAEYGLFPIIRYAGNVYTLTIRITNLSTGQNIFTDIESKSEEVQLYNIPGCAIDLFTIKLCDKLGIFLSPTKRYILENGDSNLTIEQQLENEKLNEANFKKLIKSYDDQLAILKKRTSVDKQIEQEKYAALKALNESKLKFAQERIKRLRAEQDKLYQDKIKDHERSKEVIERRNELALEVENRIKIIRTEEINNLSLMKRLSTVESKKKILIDICNNLEIQKQAVKQIYEDEFKSREQSIWDKPYRAGELSNGNPTELAIQKRFTEVENEKKAIYKKCEEELLGLTKSIFQSKEDITYDIYKNYNDLKRNDRYISSLTTSNELYYSIGPFDANKQGWKFYAYFYSDGVLLGQKDGYIYLKNLSGRNYDLNNSADYDVYLDDTDLYNSLFIRNEKIINFELSYNVETHPSQKSKYNVHLKELVLKDTVNDRVLQIFPVNKIQTVECLPAYEINGLIQDVLPLVQDRLARENYLSDEEKRELQLKEKIRMIKQGSIALSTSDVFSSMIEIKDKGIKVLATEVTQSLYQQVMNENPSTFKGKALPVESVSWVNSIIFCNKLSILLELEPYYVVGGESNPEKWKIPSDEKGTSRWADKIRINKNSKGFRLPTVEEWDIFANGKNNYLYSGGNNIGQVGWYKKNSNGETHEVGSKIPNDYGIFDLSGNVSEWCWDIYYSQDRSIKGGSWNDNENYCTIKERNGSTLSAGYRTIGFRFICSN